MIDEKEWNKTICFSNEPAEKINKTAFEIDHRLFMFAHYSPKLYISTESYYSRFRTAISNMYGLLQDCGPFMRSILSEKNNGILWQGWTPVIKNHNRLWNGIKTFRTIFCHNCYPDLALNEECFLHAEEWTASIIGEELPVSQLKEEHWKQMLAELVILSETLITDLNYSLSLILKSKKVEQKEKTVKHWIKCIANSYCTNPEFLLQTMADLYLWYQENGGDTSRIRGMRDLRKDTIQWLTEYCDAPQREIGWYKKWLGNNRFDIDAPEGNPLYELIINWPVEWAQWNNMNADECDEPPLPGSAVFRILASDVDAFAADPGKGYYCKTTT